MRKENAKIIFWITFSIYKKCSNSNLTTGKITLYNQTLEGHLIGNIWWLLAKSEHSQNGFGNIYNGMRTNVNKINYLTWKYTEGQLRNKISVSLSRNESFYQVPDIRKSTWNRINTESEIFMEDQFCFEFLEVPTIYWESLITKTWTEIHEILV